MNKIQINFNLIGPERNFFIKQMINTRYRYTARKQRGFILKEKKFPEYRNCAGQSRGPEQRTADYSGNSAERRFMSY